jgi:uncharacterized phosphosugar-binding protein
MSSQNNYIDAVLKIIRAISGNLNSIIEIAGEVAEKITAGGNIYTTDEESGFAMEMTYRSGGMMLPLPLQNPDQVKKGDVLLASTLNLNPKQQQEQFDAVRKRGGFVVLFGSNQSPLTEYADRLVDNTLPPGTVPVVEIKGKEKVCPAASVANITAAWLLVGELVAACTRLGKMPVMYASNDANGGVDWNGKYQGLAFHQPGEFNIPPLQKECLSRTYLADITRCIESIKYTQQELLEAAGQLGAETLKNNKKVYCSFNGHFLLQQLGLPGTPPVFTVIDPLTTPISKVNFESGDIFVWVGYYYYPNHEIYFINIAKVKSVWINGARAINPITLEPGKIIIDPYWGYGDASVAVPGYPIRILPPSGIIQGMCLWTTAAEIALRYF